MKKKVFGIVTLCIFLISAAVVPGVLAAVPVTDVANTAETHATFLQTAQNTVNTATQIANQVLELTSLSPEAMLVHALGLEEDLGKMIDTIKQAKGLMDSIQTAEKAWDAAFKQTEVFFEGKTSHIENLADDKKMIHTLDKTYQDSFRVAKNTIKIDEKVKRLSEVMKKNQNVAGNKSALQTQNELIAQQNELYIEQNQVLAGMAIAVIADLAKKNQLEARAISINQNCIEAGRKEIAEIEKRRAEVEK